MRHSSIPTLLLVTLLGLTGCSAEAAPQIQGDFAFAVLGDAPYGPRDERRFRQLIDELNAEDLAWVVHVGDILAWPCSDSLFRARFQTLQQIRHPLVYTPGDNEWTDCHARVAGGYAPLERLRKLREIFFPNPAESTGGRVLPLTTQSHDTAFAEFVENARWVHGRIVFATIHVVGSRNALDPFAGRAPYDDAEVARRMAAAIAWLHQAFAVAHEIQARAVFLVMHADPFFDAAPGDRPRRPFDALLEALEEEVERFNGPVVLAHGDTHVQRLDKPLTRRTTGRRLENFTRLEVFGSPDVGWVRVVVDTLHPDVFQFQPQKVR